MSKNNHSLESLRAQYLAEIEEFLQESEHVYRLTIDYELLDLKVTELLKNAKIAGLEDKVIWDLLLSRIPSYINYVNYKFTGKKSA